MQTAALAFLLLLSAGVAAAAEDQVRPPPGHPPFPSPDAPPAQPLLPMLGKALEIKPEPDKDKPKPPEAAAAKAAPAKAPAKSSEPAKPADTAKAPAATSDKPTRARTETAHKQDAPRGRVCFSQSETRDKIAAHKLTEPFRALKKGNIPGEALRVRLCRWKTDEYMYEISVLRRDGRVSHVYMNAESGQLAGAMKDDEHK